MDTTICPKCGTVNSVSVVKCKGYCKECRGILILATEHSHEIDAPDEWPWNDGGEDIVVDEYISPDAIGRPFEIYFYKPRAGYGKLIFFENGIGFKFPEGNVDDLADGDLVQDRCR